MKEYSGLSSKEAGELILKFGKNKLPEKKSSLAKKIANWIISPVSLMLLAAATLSLFKGDQVDFYIILFLFVSNFIISFWHERKADKSIEKLQERLSFKVKVLRDGSWIYINSEDIVAGDIVELQIGIVVPADMEIISENNLSINESVLTGESLPKEKKENDTAFSGSFVSTGKGVGKVSAIGANTNFGKTIASIDMTQKRSSLERDILVISKYISVVSLIVVAFITLVFSFEGQSMAEIGTLDLSLLIAGIPVALPTVMSLIISIGVLELSKKNVIIRRLASLEDLANVNMLLSDKTGTLTENRISVEEIIPFGNYSKEDVVLFAVSAVTDIEGNNPLDKAVSLEASRFGIMPFSQISSIPGDSERKRNSVVVNIGGSEKAISMGAPGTILSLCNPDTPLRKKFEEMVSSAALRGYRVHAVAMNRFGKEEKNMELIGAMLLADKIRDDASETIRFMKERGIEVKMLTGDNFEIGKRVASTLGISGEMKQRSFIDQDKDFLLKNFSSVAGFAEVVSKDKYDIVNLARRNHTVAVTGDGINDLPAIKASDVGFAVKNAVPALKSTADIVLLSDGISVIKDAIIEARKIFMRLYNYSIYRISESFRIIITIAVIGFVYKTYPLTPVQLIVLAFLNDIPIVSLAFDKVKVLSNPAHINISKRFYISTLFGIVGVANSLLMFYLTDSILHLPWGDIQTIFFLKLTVSGHMLIYVAHTEEKWFKFLPSKQVILATGITQAIATALALFGIFTAKISLALVVFVWIWSLFWMQISELMKTLEKKINKVLVKSA